LSIPRRTAKLATMTARTEKGSGRIGRGVEEHARLVGAQRGEDAVVTGECRSEARAVEEQGAKRSHRRRLKVEVKDPRIRARGWAKKARSSGRPRW
jgi:hypothetical protein